MKSFFITIFTLFSVSSYASLTQDMDIPKIVKAIKANIVNNPNYDICYGEDFTENSQYTLEKDYIGITYINELVKSGGGEIKVTSSPDPLIEITVYNILNKRYHKLYAYTDYDFKQVIKYRIDQLKGTKTYLNSGDLINPILEPTMIFEVLKTIECEL